MKYSETDRKRRGKRRKKHYFRNIALSVLVVLGLYFLAFYSGIFDVKKMNIENNVHYTAAQVAELTGVVLGDNLFKTRVSEVAKRLEQDPYIRKADVRWALPDGLDIVLDERKESVLLAYDGGYAILGYDGIILRLTKEPLILPVITGLTPIDLAPGTALKAEEAGLLKPGLDFIAFVEKNDFYIKRLDLGGVIPKAYVFDKLVIEGDLRNMERGMNEIKRIIADLDSKGIERGTVSAGNGSCSFSPEIRY